MASYSHIVYLHLIAKHSRLIYLFIYFLVQWQYGSWAQSVNLVTLFIRAGVDAKKYIQSDAEKF